MRKKRILKIAIFTLVILAIEYSVFGAISVKEGNRDSIITGGTVSEYYNMALEIKNSGQGLEGVGENVKVHMANISEYAAVLNFSNSNYGTAGEEDAEININGNKHQSSNRQFIRSDEFNLQNTLYFKLSWQPF